MPLQAKRVPIRELLNGPRITIRVGLPPKTEDFSLPKALLSESSTYFQGVLKDGFRETSDNLIVLDDEDIEVFRSYAAWVYERTLLDWGVCHIGPFEGLEYEVHLVELYIFAYKRGIPLLENDAISCLAHYTHIYGALYENTIVAVYHRVPKGSALHRFLVDDAAARGALIPWAAHDDPHDQMPKDFCVDVLRAQLAHSPYKRLCDYHSHRYTSSEDDNEDKSVDPALKEMERTECRRIRQFREREAVLAGVL